MWLNNCKCVAPLLNINRLAALCYVKLSIGLLDALLLFVPASDEIMANITLHYNSVIQCISSCEAMGKL